MSDLPGTIPFSRVREALGSLGIPVDHVVSVTFEVDSVIVEQVRTDPESGRSWAAGNSLATVTTVIGYDRKAEV